MADENFLIKGMINKELLEVTKIKNINGRTFFIGCTTHYRYLRTTYKMPLDIKIASDEERVAIGIEIKLEDNILTIKNNLLFRYREVNKIIDNCIDHNLISDSGGGILIDMIKYDTKDSRKLLLENLLHKYRGNSFIPSCLHEIEQGPIFNFKRKVGGENKHRVYLDKVIGTDHDDYMGYSWYENFFILKRPGTIFDTIVLKNSMNTLINNDFGDEKINFIKIDDKYFVSDGNHRTVISKIIGVPYINNCNVEIYKTDINYLNLFNKIKESGFLINFSECKWRRHSKLREDCEYNWEKFNVKLDNGKDISLYGIEEIKYFIRYINNLNKPFNLKVWIKRMKMHIWGIHAFTNDIEYFILKNFNEIITILNKESSL